MHEPSKWDMILKPKRSLLAINFLEIWNYRDLATMFVKRDIVTVYKQTILGPIWYVLQPLLTTFIYMFIFGRVAGLSTDGLPQILFYLSGITIWNFFSDGFNTTSKTFMENAQIFGKVYFPRIIMPASKIISALIKFTIQFGLFLAVFLYFLLSGNEEIQPNWTLALLPLLVIIMSMLALGFGTIFTSLTIKYRDLNFLLQFGIQLLMFLTPVIYPLSAIPQKFQWVIQYNPLTPLIEGFRYAFLGAGTFSLQSLAYSALFSIITLMIGLVIFNKTERSFIDSV